MRQTNARRHGSSGSPEQGYYIKVYRPDTKAATTPSMPSIDTPVSSAFTVKSPRRHFAAALPTEYDRQVAEWREKDALQRGDIEEDTKRQPETSKRFPIETSSSCRYEATPTVPDTRIIIAAQAPLDNPSHRQPVITAPRMSTAAASSPTSRATPSSRKQHYTADVISRQVPPDATWRQVSSAASHTPTRPSGPRPSPIPTTYLHSNDLRSRKASKPHMPLPAQLSLSGPRIFPITESNLKWNDFTSRRESARQKQLAKTHTPGGPLPAPSSPTKAKIAAKDAAAREARAPRLPSPPQQITGPRVPASRRPYWMSKETATRRATAERPILPQEILGPRPAPLTKSKLVVQDFKARREAAQQLRCPSKPKGPRKVR